VTIADERRVVIDDPKARVLARSGAPSALDEIHKARLVLKAEIDSLRSNHNLYLDSVADAAYIAAHQVQAVELERRTAGESYTLSDFIFEIVLTFIPFGKLANQVIHKFLGSMINRMLKTRLAFKVLPLGDNAVKIGELRRVHRDFLIQKAIEAKLNPVEAIQQADKKLENFYDEWVNHTSEIRKAYFVPAIAQAEEGLQALTTVSLTPKGEVNVKVWSSAQSVGGDVQLSAEDRPSVAFLRQCLLHVRRQKAVQNLQFDLMLHLTDFGAYDSERDDVLNAANALFISLPDHNLAEFLDRLSRYFEACIWALTYEWTKFEFDPSQGRLRKPGSSDEFNPLVLAYLIKRLYVLRGRGTLLTKRTSSGETPIRSRTEGPA
jgi:hypothetical protein